MSAIDVKAVEQFIEITGLDETTAITLLEMNAFNLEQAIHYHLESASHNFSLNNFNDDYDNDKKKIIRDNQSNLNKNKRNDHKKRAGTGAGIDLIDNNNEHTSFVSENASLPDIIENPNGIFSYNTTTTTTTTIDGNNLNNIINDDDNMRPPIPSKREQLLLPEEDQFRLHHTNVINTRKRRPSNGIFTFCPFRDFTREAQIQEELSVEFNSLASDNNSIGGIHDQLERRSFKNNNKNGSLNIDNNNDISNKRVSSRFKKKFYKNINGDNNDDIDKNISKLSKRKRLEDLFRPPIDLLFWGTFQAARDHASALNKWLIVNLQDQKEFKSQILNRDVWSDKAIKEIVSSDFILWQVSTENPEGLRFKTFYNVAECPYVCIIDPRTGENRFTCDITRPKILHDDLMKFLVENDFCLDMSFKIKPSTSKTASYTATSISTTDIPSTSKYKNNDNVIKTKVDCEAKTFKTLDLSEEDQLELAIKNSLKETQSSLSDESDNEENEKFDSLHSSQSNNSDDLNTSSASTVESNLENVKKLHAKHNFEKTNEKNIKINTTGKNTTIVSYKNLIASDNDSITKIQIRLPNGEREDTEWPSKSALKYLKSYIYEKYPDITKETYKIIQSYPRKNILELEDEMTLIEAELYPTSILYLHPDD